MAFKEKMINGTIVNSYVTCKKKAWLQARSISANKNNTYLQAGKIYAEIRKDVSKRVGNIEIDEIEKGKYFLIKEYKKTFSNFKASKTQLLFYMYNLQKELKLKKIKGVLVSEETNEKKYLSMDKKNKKDIELFDNKFYLMKEEYLKTISIK